MKTSILFDILARWPLLVCLAGTMNAASLAANSFRIMVAKLMETLWAQ
jgi:hypothetical protein